MVESMGSVARVCLLTPLRSRANTMPSNSEFTVFTNSSSPQARVSYEIVRRIEDFEVQVGRSRSAPSAVFDPCITGRPNSMSAVARGRSERRPERSKLSETYSARHPGPPQSSTVTPQCSILAQALLGTIAEQAHGVREQSTFRPWTRHHGGRSLHRRSGSRRTG